jgi:hypothetical protein
VNRLLPESLRDITKYSNQNVIGFDQEAEMPSQFYPNEPQHGWCYYFERAELARQQGDWDQVVKLGDIAFKLEDSPNDPFEYFIFIEGYAHAAEWEKAVELSQTSYKISKNYVGPPLCKLWDRINLNTEGTPEKKVTLDIVQNKFACVP